MVKKPLDDFMRISLRQLVIGETKELNRIGIKTSGDWDSFMKGVFKNISDLSPEELLALVKALAKEDDATPWRNFDTIAQIIDMHSEAHPDVHPNENIRDFLERIAVAREHAFGLISYRRRYGKY